MDSDNRFYVQRYIGGRLTGTVSGAAYFRATEHADNCIRLGYADKVTVREREARNMAELIAQDEARERSARAARQAAENSRARLVRRAARERGSSGLVLLLALPGLLLVLLVMVKVAAVLSTVATVGGVQ
jgi:hypothetical protein